MKYYSLETAFKDIGLDYKFCYKDSKKKELDYVLIDKFIIMKSHEVELLLDDVDFNQAYLPYEKNSLIRFKEHLNLIVELFQRDEVVVFRNSALSFSQSLKNDTFFKTYYLKSVFGPVSCSKLTKCLELSYSDFMLFDKLLVPINDELSQEEIKTMQKDMLLNAGNWHSEPNIIDFSSLSEKEVTLILNNIISETFFIDYYEGYIFETDEDNERFIYNIKSKEKGKFLYSISFNKFDRLAPTLIKYKTEYKFPKRIQNKVVLTWEVINIIASLRFLSDTNGDWWE